MKKSDKTLESRVAGLVKIVQLGTQLFANTVFFPLCGSVVFLCLSPALCGTECEFFERTMDYGHLCPAGLLGGRFSRSLFIIHPSGGSLAKRT